MMVAVKYYTDPLCPWSWANEPSLRKLMGEFEDELGWTFVMAGLERDLLGGRRASIGPDAAVVAERTATWLGVTEATGAPIDPLIWMQSPPASSQPACMAVKVASHLADDAGYGLLRVLREGFMCRRRKLDGADALTQAARQAGLDPVRFQSDLRSHATTEELGMDLERTKELAARGLEAGSASDAAGAPLPTAVFAGEDGAEHLVAGYASFEALREAALKAGAKVRRPDPLTIAEAVARFGTLTTAEVQMLCDLPGPRAEAELFRLAEQWKLRPERILTGYLWAAA